MSKVVFLADVHLGVGNRHNDIMWALKTVHKYCQARKITNIITLGDLFHDRQTLNIDILCEAHDFFKMAKNSGQEWTAFLGNHDMYLKHNWQINSIKPLQEVLTFIDNIKIIKIDTQRFWILPFIYSEKAYIKTLQQIEEQYQEGDVLLTHIGINNAIKNVCFLLQEWNTINFTNSKFKQVYSGHFHVSQQVDNNVWYIGSIIPFRFDEGDSSHGFILYDTETQTHTFKDIWQTAKQMQTEGEPTPQYKTIPDNTINEQTENNITGCNIRIMVSKDYSQSERQGVREHLTQLGAKTISFNDTLIKRETIEQTIADVDSMRMDELFTKLYETDIKGTKGLKKALAQKLNIDIIQEGDALYLERLECN